MHRPATKIEAPPRIVSGRQTTVPLCVVLAALGLVGLTLLFLFDPARHVLYPACLFKKVTGYDCPGCGGLRALHHLLRGEVGEAFRLNALVVATLPLLSALAFRAWRKSAPPRPTAVLLWFWLLFALLVLFGIVRNLPLWPFGVTPS